MNKDSYHKHIHKDSSLVTLIDFVNDGASIGSMIDVMELISYEDELGEKNINKIFQLYTIEDIDLFISRVGLSDASKIITKTVIDNKIFYVPLKSGLIEENRVIIGQLPLVIGTELILPLDKINREMVKFDTNQVVDFRTFKQYISAQLYYLLKDPKYEHTYKIKEKNTINSIRDVFPFISVWVWSRSLSDENNKDTIINITPFITSLNTSVSGNGGSFNLSLAPVSTEYVENEGWVIDKNLKVTGNSFISDNGFYKSQKTDSPKRNDFYFHRSIQENDVIFIRFEKLDIEENRGKLDKSFLIDKQDLAGNIYDMIGLVDANIISTNGSSNDVSINVSGRDLVKLFIEDGVYFFPYDYIQSGIFANENVGDRLERYDGQLKSRFQLGFKNIENTFKFIFNALSTIKITSDTLFDSYRHSLDISDLEYKDRISKKYYTDRVQLLEVQKEIESQNIEQGKIKELIEQSISIERIKQKPSVESVYSKLFNFISSLKKHKDGSLIIEKDGKITGWKTGLTYDTNSIDKNELPIYFANRLYLDKMYWRDASGKIITDQERLKFINKILKESDAVQKELNNLFIQKEQRKTTPADNTQVSTVDKNYIESQLKGAKNAQGELIYKDDAFKAKDSIDKVEQKEIDKLTKEYDEIFKKYRSIRLYIAPKKFDELNKYAQEAIRRIYDLLKRIEKQNNQPEKTIYKDTKGIWQIIDLLIDDNIRDRRIVDSSIGNEHGSLINAFRKIAQEPFVEMLMDTYGDKYTITVRKPPFDEKGMINMLEDTNLLISKPLQSLDLTSTYNNSNKSERVEQKQSIVIDINDSDVISDNLTYGLTSQIYSWYRLTPQNLIAGQASDMAFAYLKAIYLKEYADIWGSKPLDISTNYIPYFPVVGKNDKLPNSYFIKQGVVDLKYMIESNAYNPFIRQGTITIVGSRLYKRGTFVRLKSTDEIFYVDAVSNNYAISSSSIDRVTTLQVSKGMVEKYIKGVKIKGINHSYFNLVNTKIDDERVLDDYNKVLANWNVNKDVFNFFIKQKQFADIAFFTKGKLVNTDLFFK